MSFSWLVVAASIGCLGVLQSAMTCHGTAAGFHGTVMALPWAPVAMPWQQCDGSAMAMSWELLRFTGAHNSSWACMGLHEPCWVVTTMNAMAVALAFMRHCHGFSWHRLPMTCHEKIYIYHGIAVKMSHGGFAYSMPIFSLLCCAICLLCPNIPVEL